jgi:hypothetical protein
VNVVASAGEEPWIDGVGRGSFRHGTMLPGRG